MSEENVALARQLLEMFAHRQHEQAMEYYAEDVEFDVSRMPQPDTGVYHGHEGVRRFWRQWLSAWADIQFEIGEIYDSGGDDVVAEIRNQRQWGRHSGLETSFGDYGIVFTVREGKVVRWRGFPDLPSALEAAGLSE